ncbi:hypothetical protein [Pelagibius sp. 7325]|uniref:hypothetical protein n=1 Tax=Pelagibius sp. 7325 TaxID=3131994 RepID=UPI0030EB41D3
MNAHGLRHCACGADLTGNQPVPASEPEISLHQWLAYLAGFGARPTSDALTALGDDLDQVMAKDLVDLAVVLGWSPDGRDPLSLLPGRKAADWAGPVRKGADLLANWPEALHGAIREKLGPDFDAFLRHRESLSEYYAASAGRFREQKFDFLRVALDQMESAQWSDFASRFRRSLPEPVARRNATTIGARSLAEDLGLTEHEVIQLARDGVLPTVTPQESGERLNWLFDSDLANEVFQDLDRHALPVPDDGFITGLPFYKARHIPRSSLLLAHLIRQARSGTIPTLAGAPRRRGMKGCIFSQRHLLEAAIPQLKSSNGQIATDAVWAYLGMTKQAWCWLQKKGYLRKALRMPVGAEMSVAQFWELLDMIVVPGNLIFGTRTGLPQGRAALDRIGAIPFASSANGSPGVLYWRRDIERKLTSYLASRR